MSIFSSGHALPTTPTEDELGDLASLPTLLHLAGFLRLFSLLDVSAKRRLACAVIAKALERDAEVEGPSQRITTEDDLEELLEVIQVLIEPDPVAADSTLAEEQSLLASVPHLIGPKEEASRNADLVLVLLKKLQKEFGTGGTAIVKATFPALVYEVSFIFWVHI